MMFNRSIKSFFVLPLVLAGCAGATMGPGAGTAKSTVKGNVDTVNQRAQGVLQDMHVTMTGHAVKDSGNEREITGMLGDTDIKVKIESASRATSNVRVEASKNLVNGNRDLAAEILNRIIQRS